VTTPPARPQVTGVADLIDRTLERATLGGWSTTLQVLVLMFGGAVCAAGLAYAAHVLLGVSPWLSGLGVASTSAGCALLRHRRQRRHGQVDHQS
jgi:membrane protein implicated in regulation of membrane protease activity